MMSLPEAKIVGNWYRVREIAPDIFWVQEPEHVSFYIFKSGSEGLFIDSGLGLTPELSASLLSNLGIETFRVLCTHAHCDHVGMNPLASETYLSKREWKKYVAAGESKQIAAYYRMLKGKPWPKSLKQCPTAGEWRPSRFLSEGEIIECGGHRLEVLSVPGHTNGHLCFFERELSYFFCGDFVYTGALYLHLPDSSLADFSASVDKLKRFSAELKRTVWLWPGHNRIPVEADYLGLVSSHLEDIREGRAPMTGAWPADEIFLRGVIFENKGVKVVIKKGELPWPYRK